jgi:hypothetical protein
VTPVAVAPSPKFQPYDVAFVDPLALKLHVRPEQLLVKLAVDPVGGGGGGPPPPMKLVLSNRFTVPLGTDVIAPGVALPVSAAFTCDGVAPGFADR